MIQQDLTHCLDRVLNVNYQCITHASVCVCVCVHVCVREGESVCVYTYMCACVCVCVCVCFCVHVVCACVHVAVNASASSPTYMFHVSRQFCDASKSVYSLNMYLHVSSINAYERMALEMNRESSILQFVDLQTDFVKEMLLLHSVVIFVVVFFSPK